MRRYFLFAILLVCSANTHALESLRVGSQLLVVGDSAAKVKQLMGMPSVRTKGSAEKSSGKAKGTSKLVVKSKRQEAKEKGEKWQYRRDGHTTIFTIANGKIAHIEDFAR
jgi:ketosteroid isomerase-like protein